MVLFTAFKQTQDSSDKISVKEVELMTGDVALVVLNKVHMPDSVAQDKLDSVKSAALREHAIRDYSSAVFAIQANADIEKNIRLSE